MSWALDHLVVAATTLEQGAAWCEATLGESPGPGGKHALMGTHNLLMPISSPAFPRSYLEIIAIDPQAPSPARRRWFDLDDPAMCQALAAGPRLIHWVARCDDIVAECAALGSAGVDRGELLQAERDTPRGLLRWRISVRADGARLCGGALPTLIEWGHTHPSDSLGACGVRLESLSVGALPEAAARRLPAGATVGTGFAATLVTPRGSVRLEGGR